MIPLAELIARFGPAYLARYGSTALPSQRQALAALGACRSRLASQMLAECSGCGEQRVVPHSCGHRACPHCQHFEGQRWIARQSQALVAAPYFLITFTLPAELRDLVWQHQRELYAALMDEAWGTLQSFGRNHRQLQGQTGAVAVLHTHSRRLDFHPHVHLAMPAAALQEAGSEGGGALWRTLRGGARRRGYLFNHKALAQVFRARFLAAVRALGLQPPPEAPERWVVDCKSVGGARGGHKVMLYLGRYLYRGVIQERDILRCEGEFVTYRWRDAKTRSWQTRTVTGVEFLRLVLQHVLPKGFRRARNYGLLHPNCKRGVALLRMLALRRRPEGVPDLARSASTPTRPALLCRCCGGAMRIVRRRILPGSLALAAPPPRKAEGRPTR